MASRPSGRQSIQRIAAPFISVAAPPHYAPSPSAEPLPAKDFASPIEPHRAFSDLARCGSVAKNRAGIPMKYLVGLWIILLGLVASPVFAAAPEPATQEMNKPLE